MKLTSKTFVLLSISLAVFLAEVFLIQKVAFAQLNVQKQLTEEISAPTEKKTTILLSEVTKEASSILNTEKSIITGEVPAVTEESQPMKVPSPVPLSPLIPPGTEELAPQNTAVTGELAPVKKETTAELKPEGAQITGELTAAGTPVTKDLVPLKKEVTGEKISEGFGKIGIDLPLESKLEITGRKGVALNYGNVIRTNPPAGVPASGGSSAGGITSGFSLLQDLQVRLSGTVGKRVTVNVDYDDTKEQQRDISLVYKGEPDEFIQSARFGDVVLSLPNTEFTGYSKNIFGGDIELRYKNLSIKAIGAQTKGKTKTVTFNGGFSQQKIDIQDVSFLRQKYFKIQTDLAGKIPAGRLPITPGSEQIWLDDLNGYNNNYPPNYPADRGADVTKYTQKTGTSGASVYLSLDYLHPGTDYTIDYTTGIITFNKSIQQNYVIVAAYKYNNGASSVGYDAGGNFDFDDSKVAGSTDPSPDDTLFGKIYNNRFIQPPLGSKYYYDSQLMNYYNLGNKKILLPLYDPEYVFKIYDQNNVEQPLANYSYALDGDSGMLNIFTNSTSSTNYEKPFSLSSKPDAYPSVASLTTLNRYKIHIEYKYKFKTYQLPNFSIVKYSETIMMDGVKKTRDLDYTIDYDSGFIFFMNEDKIAEKTEIIVTYEYMPFGGGFQSNLFGARAELKLDTLSLGSTYLYTGGQTPADVPAAGSSPQSLSVLDVDAKLTVNQALIDSVFGRLFFLPTEINFSGEIAKSMFNPNIYQAQNKEQGTGMIDGMENSDNVSGLSNDYNSWFCASTPYDNSDILQNPANRGERLGLSNYDDYGHDLTSTAKKQLFKIDYNLGAGSWDAIRYVVSSSGTDYTKFRYLELWVKADDWTRDIDFNINIGTISEDINGNGILDTEDANGDGVLNAGEDTGIPVNFNGVIVGAGAGNNRMDKEDLDNNGKLDTDEKYYAYSFKINNANSSNYVASTVGDWKLIKIPLNFATSTAPLTHGIPSASLIKHIRFWLKSTTGAAGSVVIESAQFTGNKWELKYPALANLLDVKAVNQILDPTYIPVLEFFTATTAADLLKEQSIGLVYGGTLGARPFVFKTLGKAINFMEYKSIKVDVYRKKTSPGDILFLRIGSDDNNYQEYQVNLDGVGQGWQTVTIPISAPAVIAGTSFYLNNVKQISMGVDSSGTGNEIWLNNLRLADPEVKEGFAYRLGGSVRYGDFFSTTVDYKKIDSTFNFFEDSSVNSALSAAQTYASVKQNQMYYSISSNIKPADFMPMSITYRREEITTSDSDKANPVYLSTPEKASDSYGSNINLTLFNPLNINVNANYKKDEVQYIATTGSTVLKLDNTSGKAYNVASRATLDLPNNFFGLIPLGTNNFEGEFKYGEDNVNHSLYPERNSNTISRDTTGKWTGAYEPLSGLNINPYYQLQQSEKRGSNFAYNSSIANSIKYLDDFTLQTISRGAGLGLSYSKLPGITPKANYTGTVQRDYNIDQLRTNSSIEFSGDLRLSEWFAFLAGASPNLNVSHRISANALYDKYSGPAADAPIKSITDMDIWGLVPKDTLAYNSSQLINDTASGRFKIATITFNPRASLSYEGNRQSQFLTKTNVYSLGSGINIENPPIFFIAFLNLQSLDIQYDYKNIIKKDTNENIISNSLSHTANMTLPFRLSDAFNGSITFSPTIEDRLENNVNYMNRTFNFGLDVFQNLNFTDPIKLPDFLFGGAVIKIDQTIRINYKLNMAMVRNNSNSLSVISAVNSDTYTAGAFIQYGFSKNIRADIGLQFNYFMDNLSNVNNYYAYGVNIKVSAVF